jgi:protein arginine N-methyltransferase 1
MEEMLSTIEVCGRELTVRTWEPSSADALSVFPCEGEYPVYNDDVYDLMNEDPSCCETYGEAISQLVRDRVVLDIGTGRDANWAIESAQAGARKVYAIEVIPEWAEAARRSVKEEGWEDVITVLTGASTDLVLPEQVDVCISEIIGSIGGSEGAAASILDAKARFMGNAGISIPHRCTTLVAGASLSSTYPHGIAFDLEGLDMVRDIFNTVGYPFDVRLCLDGETAEGVRRATRDSLVTDVGDAEDLRFNTGLVDSGEDHLRLTVTRADLLTGLVLWPRLQVIDGGPVIDSLHQETGWSPCYAPLFTDGVAVQPGDVLDLRFRWQLSDDGRHPDYAVTGSIERAGRPRAPFTWNSPHHAADFRSSAIYQWLFPVG